MLDEEEIIDKSRCPECGEGIMKSTDEDGQYECDICHYIEQE